MNVRPIATWSFEPWLKRKGGNWERTEYMLAVAKASLEYVRQHYGNPTIYTDILGVSVFEKIAPFANCIPVYDNVFHKVKPHLWAYAKLVTYSLQKEPYLHFDLDFWFRKPITEQQLSCDVLVHGIEILDGYDPYNFNQAYNLPIVGHLYDLPDIFKCDNPNSIPAVNTGCLLMNNMELHRIYVDNVIDLISRNEELLNSNKALDICVLEQHTLGMILHRNPQWKCNTMFETGWDVPPVTDQAVHFVGPNYKTSKHASVVEFCKQNVDPWVDDTIWKLADELNGMRNQALIV